MRESLNRAEIIRRRRDLRALIRSGVKIPGTGLTLRFLRQEKAQLPIPPAHQSEQSRVNRPSLPDRRVAFLLNSDLRGAVVRNRLKRRLREIYRRNKNWFPPEYDYLIHIHRRAAQLDFAQLKREVHLLAAAATQKIAQDHPDVKIRS